MRALVALVFLSACASGETEDSPADSSDATVEVGSNDEGVLGFVH